MAGPATAPTEKNANGLSRVVALVGLVSFALGAGGSLMAVGAAQGTRDARIAVLEDAGKSAKADHDDVVTLKADVRSIVRDLEEVNRKLDRLMGAAGVK